MIGDYLWFQVIAQDAGGGPGSLSSSATLTVHLEDSNDHAPVFQQELYSLSLYESEPVGSLVGQINATDADEGTNAKLYYSLRDGGKGAFYIDTTTGRFMILF